MKIKSQIHQRLALLLLLGSFSLSSLVNAQLQCSNVLSESPFKATAVIDTMLERGPFLVPVGAPVDAKLMFGFESEYVPRDTAAILKVYCPDAMAKEQWLALNDQERVSHFESMLSKKALGNKRSGFTKITEDPELSFLPKYFIIDDTGNLEIVLDPVDSYTEWRRRKNLINSMFTTGSQQAMVSVPISVLFPDNVPKTESYDQVVGAFNFIHEKDTLDRMHEGALKFMKDSSKLVLRTFAHPFLGPISRTKQIYMQEQLLAVANHTRVFFDTLTSISSKFIGSTTPRPDIGASMGRMGAEVRDAHQDEKKLDEKTDRISVIFLGDRHAFKIFKDIHAVDTQLDFSKFSEAAQGMLAQFFPTRRDQTFGSPREIFALEVYRNFAYPLKDWSADLLALGRLDLAEQVAIAQSAYLAKIEHIAQNWVAGEMTEDIARSEVQGHCALFAIESGLYQAYSEAEETLMSSIGQGIIQSEHEQSLHSEVSL